MNVYPVSVHTASGALVGDLPCSSVPRLVFSRESGEVSRCELDISAQADPELIEDLRPWLHWITVWDSGAAVWTGPVQRIVIDDTVATVSARDVSTLMWRTRVPVSKSWSGEDPSAIAAELWDLMLDLHGVGTRPVLYPDVTVEKFDYQAVADSRMLHQTMNDLTTLGLTWSVVAGTPVFGPPVSAPVETLRECDFLVGLRVIRDGVDTFNDVRVQGKNFAETYTEPLAGLNLQTLVSIDDLFGVANIQRATRQYARSSSRIKDVLDVPASASLHPDAPVTLADLVPGTLFQVQARGLSTTMRLDQMVVSSEPGAHTITVTLASLPAVSELTGKANT